MRLLPRPALVAAALGLCALAAPRPAAAQAPSDPSYRRLAMSAFPTARALTDSLARLAATSDATLRAATLDRLWADLRAAGQVPFAAGGEVVWLWRGAASSVAWAGDMTGWQPRAAGTRVTGTDLWTRTDTFADDARLDYKVVVGGNDWRLDAANPLQQWSGFGPNSELRMPAYRYPTETVRRAGVPAGILGPNERLRAASLGYDINVRVYTPAGFDTLRERPGLLVVTDGHEYAPDGLGALVTVLDNTIHDQQTRPLVVVFVDPRNPDNAGQNRRQDELVPAGGSVGSGRAAAFLAFLAGDLVPRLDARYRIAPGAANHGILGTSLGGLFAAYAGAERPDVFGAVAMQSPAFWAYDAIYDRVRTATETGQRRYLSQGTVGDGDGGDRMAAVLNGKGVAYTYARRNEGHSWGQWRALGGSMLRTLFPGARVTSTTGAARIPRLRLDAFPTPTRDTVGLRFDLPAETRVRVTLVDALGRTVVRADRGRFFDAGTTTLTLDTSALASGVYIAHLDGDGGLRATASVVVGR